MAEPTPPAGITPSQEQQRPHSGGRDRLTQLIDEGLNPLDAPLPAPGMTGHPWETPPEEGEAPPVTEPGARGEPTPPPTPSFRYQSQEEAERAEGEAQRKITEEAQRRAALEREIELYRQHNALLERQIQQGTTPQTPTPGEGPSSPSQQAPIFSPKEHFRQAYQRMSALNPAAEDYETQQQHIFIDALDEAFSHLSTTTALTDTQINARIEAGIQAALPAVQQQVRQQTERERLLGKLTRYGSEHGLDMAEDGEHYQDVMYAVERNLYPATLDEDGAISYVVDRVAQLRGVAQPTPSAGSPPGNGARPAPTTPPSTTPQRAQALNTPMERSGMGRQQQAPDEMDTRSFSLSEMLDRSMRVRRP